MGNALGGGGPSSNSERISGSPLTEQPIAKEPPKSEEPLKPKRYVRPRPAEHSSAGEACFSLSPSAHLRTVLYRNDEANKHSKASQIQAKGHPVSDLSELSSIGAGGSSGGGDATAAATITAATSTTTGSEPTTTVDALNTLWKDLVKYGKQVSSVASPEDLSSAGIALLDESLLADEVDDAPEDLPMRMAEAAPPSSSAGGNAGVAKSLFRHSVEIITVVTNGAGGRSLGVLEITSAPHKLIYTRNQEDQDFDFVNATGNNEFMWACRCHPSRSWDAGDIVFLMKREFLMKPSGVEVFFSSSSTAPSSVFFCFESAAATKEFFQTIRSKVRPRNFNPALYGEPRRVLQRNLFSSGAAGGGKTLTAAWQNREISNFDYLLMLNMIAGRSFQDLSQYPVFPWVIADYSSKTLDLKKASTFRDLNHPIKAQRKEQRDTMQEKYEVMREDYQYDQSQPPRHTGSHFSTPGHVIWYMVRQEPFTSLHVWFQNGKFDKPDRLFDSIRSTYEGSIGPNLMDVKELIPEFFYNAEFLENVNGIDLGATQTGRQIGSVQLPPWAQNAHDFVRLNREALECDYVSRNLHAWIDLVFGFSQRPPHILGGNESCVRRCNVFCNISYRNAVDLKALAEQDHPLYLATLRQISEFGQVPECVFTEPHTPRRSMLDLPDVLCWPLASVLLGASTYEPAEVDLRRFDDSPAVLSMHKPKGVVSVVEGEVSQHPILFLAELEADKQLLTVDVGRLVGLHSFLKRPLDSQPPLTLKTDRRARLLSEGKHGAALMSLTQRMGYKSASASRERSLGVAFWSGVASEGEGHETPLPDGAELTVWLAGLGAGGGGLWRPVSKTEVLRKETLRRQTSSDSAGSGGMPGAGGAAGLPTPEKSRRPTTRDKERRTTSAASEQSTSAGSRYSADAASSNRSQQQQAWEREHPLDHLGSQLFALVEPHRLLVSAGHFDFSFRVTLTDTGRLVQSVQHHGDVVTCVAASSCDGHCTGASGIGSVGVAVGKGVGVGVGGGGVGVAGASAIGAASSAGYWLVTGSRDCTAAVWHLSPADHDHHGAEATEGPVVLQHVLFGHEESVTCVALRADLDVVLSGSDDGTVAIHSLREGLFLRCLVVGSPLTLRARLGSAGSGSESSAAVAMAAGQGIGGLGGEAPDSGVWRGGGGGGGGGEGEGGTGRVWALTGAAAAGAAGVAEPELELASEGNSNEARSTSVSMDLSSASLSHSALGSLSNLGSPQSQSMSSLLSSKSSPAPASSRGLGLGPSSSGSLPISSGISRHRVSMLCVSAAEPCFVVYSRDGNMLFTFSINGRLLKQQSAGERLHAMCMSEDGKVLLTGGNKCVVILRWVLSLKLANDHGREGLDAVVDGSCAGSSFQPFDSPIRSLLLTAREHHLVVGLHSGRIRVLAHDSEYLRVQVLARLQRTGFLK